MGKINGRIALRNLIHSESFSWIPPALWEMPGQENRTAALLILWMVFRVVCVPHRRATMSRRNVRSVEFHGTHPAPLLTCTYFHELVIYFRAARAEGKQDHYVLASLIFSDKITLQCVARKRFCTSCASNYETRRIFRSHCKKFIKVIWIFAVCWLLTIWNFASYKCILYLILM